MVIWQKFSINFYRLNLSGLCTYFIAIDKIAYMSVGWYALDVGNVHVVITAEGNIWRARWCRARQKDMAPAISWHHNHGIFARLNQTANANGTYHP